MLVNIEVAAEPDHASVPIMCEKSDGAGSLRPSSKAAGQCANREGVWAQHHIMFARLRSAASLLTDHPLGGTLLRKLANCLTATSLLSSGSAHSYANLSSMVQIWCCLLHADVSQFEKYIGHLKLQSINLTNQLFHFPALRLGVFQDVYTALRHACRFCACLGLYQSYESLKLSHGHLE